MNESYSLTGTLFKRNLRKALGLLYTFYAKCFSHYKNLVTQQRRTQEQKVYKKADLRNKVKVKIIKLFRK